MKFHALIQQVAAENNTIPEHVYREMQIAIEDAFAHRYDSAETLAAWKELGFAKRCPTPEQFIAGMTLKIRSEVGILRDLITS